MTTFPSVPPEIRDAIIDEVGSEALGHSAFAPLFRQTLLSFHAASTATRRRALKYLYKKIQVSIEDHAEERIKALRDLIEFSHVDTYIKEMDLSFAALLPTHRRLPTQLSPQDLLGNKDLIFIMRRLTGKDFSVEKLTLRVCRVDSRHFNSLNWTDFPLSFRTAFQALVCSPHLLSLHIDDVSKFPVAMLEGSHLKNLVIYQPPETSHEGETNVLPSNNYPYLESLHTNYEALTHNSSTIYRPLFQNLTELVVKSRWDDPCVTLRQALMQCGQNLSKLTLNILGPLEFDFESLSIIPNLKAFVITYSGFPDTFGSQVTKIQHLALLLSITRPMKYLEEITLGLGLRDNDGFGPFMDIKHPDWKLIDESLSSAMYPNLRRVEVSVRANMVYVYSEDFNEDQFLTESGAYLAEQFRRLKDSDVSFSCHLTCKCEVLEGHRDDN